MLCEGIQRLLVKQGIIKAKDNKRPVEYRRNKCKFVIGCKKKKASLIYDVKNERVWCS